MQIPWLWRLASRAVGWLLVTSVWGIGCGQKTDSVAATGGATPATGGDLATTGGEVVAPTGGVAPASGGDGVGGVAPGLGGDATGAGGAVPSGGATTSGAPTSGGGVEAPTGGSGGSPVGGGAGGGAGTGGTSAVGGAGGSAGAPAAGGADVGPVCTTPVESEREQPAYPAIDEAEAGCGAWTLVDNVCCAQYCASDPSSESCDACAGTDDCVAVSSKGCISGKWPEARCVTEDEPWHYSRSTHYGLTNSGACAFGYYGMCTTPDKYDFGDSAYAEQCDAFCKAYPSLCADPEGTTLRGNFVAPQGNYYTQFWPSLPGDWDNYLSCGECFEMIRTKPDGSEYQPGEEGYTSPIVAQVTDSCPCSANSKWCCGSGRNHCAEITSGSLDFAYGCPLPPGDLPADHEPQADESIHIDLSDIAMARLQSGDSNGLMMDGVIPTRYRRVPCPAIGNIYVWVQPQAGEYYFSLSVVNVAGAGSIVALEAQLASGEWSSLHRDTNYTTSRPQERYGTWVVAQGEGPFSLPVSLRFTAPDGTTLEAPGAIKSFSPTDPAQDPQMYYVDTGVQF